MGSHYLSEVLNCQDIINEPNQRICILSGVGSGKNTFIEENLSQHGNILYISSRRAKVNEILENKLCGDNIEWDKESSDIVVVTNSGIERMVQNKKFEKNLNEIINHFDFVVVDEVHSLFTDSTFTNSSYHVFAFIEHIASKYGNIKIIIMTGTPEPIDTYLKIKNYTIFDKRSECKHVLPKVIQIVDKDYAFKCIASLPKSEKTIYYTTSATQIVRGKNSLINRLNKAGLSENEIAICVSDSSAQRLESDYSGLKELCSKTKGTILKNGALDEHYKILLTTSCLKEGVNIENKDIRIAFCESHVLSEIRQFAGRIRSGLDVLYIISDARQHNVSDEQLHKFYLELHYANYTGKKSANKYIEDIIKNEESGLYITDGYFDRGYIDIADLYQGEYSLAVLGGNLIPMYISLIESTNQYLKFNHLTGLFEVYANRFIEQRRINSILREFNWITDIKDFSAQNGVEFWGQEIMHGVDENEIIEYCKERENIIWVFDEKSP